MLMYKTITSIFGLFFMAFNVLLIFGWHEPLNGFASFLFYISVPSGTLLDFLFTLLFSGVIDWGQYETADMYVATVFYCLGGCAQYMLLAWMVVKAKKRVQG